MRFSASRLKTWMECSLQAYYRYEERLPQRQNAKASFGTVIHRALQHYNEQGNDYQGAVALFKDLWGNPAKAGVEPDYWPRNTSYGDLRKRGLEALERYHQGHRLERRDVIGTEVPFLVPFGEHELTGFIDLVDLRFSAAGRSILAITDYKTNSREPSRTGLALDIQFSIYHYAAGRPEFWMGVPGNPDFPGLPNGEWLWETVGKMATRRCIWYQVLSAKEIDAGPRSQEDYQRIYRVCNEVAAAVESGVYVPKIGEACLWCDYVEPCQMEVPVAISALEDTSDPTRWV